MDARNALEEIQIQIRIMAVAVKGVGIEGVHGVPQRIVHVAAVQGVEFDAGLGDAAAFALGLLALLGGEGRKKGVEGIVALVEPMKLTVAAQDQIRRRQALAPCPRSGKSTCQDDSSSLRA